MRSYPLAYLRQIFGGCMALLFACLTVADASAQAMGGYGGPTVLSRAGDRPGRRGGMPLDFNVQGSARAVVDTNLTTGAVNEDGTIAAVNRTSLAVLGEAFGAKVWKRDSLGLDYRADYRRTSNAGQELLGRSLSGTNQALSLDYGRIFNRRTNLSLRTVAGTSNRAFGAFAAPSLTQLSDLGVPTEEVFDRRFYFFQQSAALGYRKSARTTYTLNVAGFAVKRTGGLPGVQGYQIGTAYNYMLSPRTSVGLQYFFLRMQYKRVFTNIDGHGVVAMISRRLTQRWHVSAVGGVMPLTIDGTRAVELTPEVAAILGRNRDVEAFRDTSVSPVVEGTANYMLDRGRFSVAVQHGVTPGNGLFLASTRNGASAGYTYSGVRRTSLGLSTSYSRISSLATELGTFTNWQAGGSASYRFAEHLALDGQADHRKFSTGVIRGRSGWSASVGLTYTPARFPVPVW